MPTNKALDYGKIADKCMYDFPKSYSTSQITAFQKGIDKMYSACIKATKEASGDE